jgi:protein-export membrane protein SecD
VVLGSLDLALCGRYNYASISNPSEDYSMKSLKWRVGLVVIVLVVAIWTLLPTFRYYSADAESKSQWTASELNTLKRKAVNLGLDLQGGMYLLMEVDRSKLTQEEAEGAHDRSVEIIRNRVDKWGVSEPSIQKLEGGRLLVELPGVMDIERARSLIGRTALLEFRLMADEILFSETLENLDRKVFEELRGLEMDTLDTLLLEERPILSMLNSYRSDIVIPLDDIDTLESYLARPEVDDKIPTGYELLFGKLRTEGGMTFRPIYLVDQDTPIKGGDLKGARHSIGSGQDVQTANMPVVSMEFNRRGAARFANITGTNVGKRLAIVLDGVVQSAPVIRERIPGGQAQITGIPSMDEAKEIAVVLTSGALPAPLNILEERSVGPLLGMDSIRRGITALIIGLIAVVLFMVIYYNLSGVVACVALVLNFVLILALLVGLKAALTLPGMAGLVLTLGMAVDANVLIFERIREELKAGKPVKTALDTGYSRALTTILDANITTLIAAFVLLRFGTGPIKGFAVTLSLGIVASLFTAIFVTRIIFDYFLLVRNAQRIRI